MNRITNEQRESIVRKAIAERDALLAKGEAYAPGWAHVSLMVSPNGELHAVGGDQTGTDPLADNPYVGLERIKQFWKRANGVHGNVDAEQMRAEFMAWVQDQGCDTDGAWSAWQAAWNRRPAGVALLDGECLSRKSLPNSGNAND